MSWGVFLDGRTGAFFTRPSTGVFINWHSGSLLARPSTEVFWVSQSVSRSVG